MAPKDDRVRFTSILRILDDDLLWESEYESFVLEVSFARPEEAITFAEALAAARRLVKSVYA